MIDCFEEIASLSFSFACIGIGAYCIVQTIKDWSKL
jgi:hypothetical protein